MYTKFIEKCKTQNIPSDVYTEKHHIIPKHMNGSNDSSNIIRLTYRQHILAHLLLYRKYKKIEDLFAYKLMKSLPEDRKKLIGQMIGEKNKQSGHIYELGRKNKETNFINEIKTKESMRRGGLAAGKIAKETGQINRIRTPESCYRGGKTQGTRARESGQIQKLGKYKGIYILIMPDGTEFQHGFQAAEYCGLPVATVQGWCKCNRNGFSRRPKTQEELDSRWSNIE